MKKVVLALVLASVISVGAFADHPNGLGIGIVGGYNGGWEGGGYTGASLSLKIPSIPIFWAINLNFDSDYFGLGVSGDKYFVDTVLLKDIGLHGYIGLGGWVNLWGFSDKLGLALGARLPLGLSWQPISILEIFLEIAPSLGIQITPDFHFPAGGWPIGLGIRIWL